MAALLIYLESPGIPSVLRPPLEQKEAIRAENARRQEMEKAKADAYEAGRAEAMSTLVSRHCRRNARSGRARCPDRDRFSRCSPHQCASGGGHLPLSAAPAS